MEPFVKIVNCKNPFTISAKGTNLGIWNGSEYVFVPGSEYAVGPGSEYVFGPGSEYVFGPSLNLKYIG